MQAAEEGFVTFTLAVPGGEDTLLHELEDYFLTNTGGATAAAWNEQRKLVLRRALLQLLYPKLNREALAAATQEAHAVLAAECARRLGEIVSSAPYRAPAEEDGGGRRKKKKEREAWRPAGAFDINSKVYTACNRL